MGNCYILKEVGKNFHHIITDKFCCYAEIRDIYVDTANVDFIGIGENLYFTYDDSAMQKQLPVNFYLVFPYKIPTIDGFINDIKVQPILGPVAFFRTKSCDCENGSSDLVIDNIQYSDEELIRHFVCTTPEEVEKAKEYFMREMFD